MQQKLDQDVEELREAVGEAVKRQYLAAKGKAEVIAPYEDKVREREREGEKARARASASNIICCDADKMLVRLIESVSSWCCSVFHSAMMMHTRTHVISDAHSHSRHIIYRFTAL